MLTVVRHGRTAENRDRKLLGRLDVGLDDVGRGQAAALAAAVGPVDRIVSSPLRRTRDTAAAWAAPVEVDERWLELDYGELDGVVMSEIEPDVWRAWRGDPAYAPPGGESIRALGERVRAACDDLCADAMERHVLVVTHVSPIKAAVAWALGVDDRVAWRMFVAPASITRIAVSASGPSLYGFNLVGHLAGPAARP